MTLHFDNDRKVVDTDIREQFRMCRIEVLERRSESLEVKDRKLTLQILFHIFKY